ncbi:MAG: hypothetical protein H6828_07010 [Planctomycetes bacterium]|nr:hypothetical protein [Planctomycetota bacterium]
MVLVAPAPAAASPADDVEWGPWQVLLPFEHPEGNTARPPHTPEDELRRLRVDGPGMDLAKAHLGKGGRELHWAPLVPGAPATREPDWPLVTFAEHFPDGLDPAGLSNNAAAYLYRTLRATEGVELPISLGSDDGVRVWLNGELIHEYNGGRGVVPTDDHLLLHLAAGENHLLVKVCNGGGAWGFQMLPDQPLDSAERAGLQPRINQAIDRGLVYLLQTQQRDGSWGYSANGYRNGQTSLSLYALLKSGVDVDHQAIRRGFAYLRGQPPRKTYALACQLLALSATNRPESKAWMAELLEELLDWQQGTFAYPDGERDLSCTQYGALGYWICMRNGLDVPKRAWTDLARGVLAYHNSDEGGFTYRPGGGSTGSMTVAGLTVIAVCREAFGDAGFPRQWKHELEAAEESGMRWLQDHFQVGANPTQGGSEDRWKYYYLYGVERLCAILELDHLGAHDWYWKGAEHLVAVQGDEGQWGTPYGENEPNTAFALLFLDRATATVSGPGASRHQGKLYATDGDDALVVLRAKGDTPLSLWVSELRPKLRETCSRDGERGRGVYLEAVEYFADGVSFARLPADPTKPWNGESYATQHSFDVRGEHEVQVALHFADIPGAEGGRPESVRSPVLKVRADAKLEEWMVDYVDDRESNLVLGERYECRASSQRGDGESAEKAFDGWASTAWISAANDRDPSLTIEFKRAVRVDRIVLSHAVGIELHRNHFDRATKVEVLLGGKRDALVFDVDPDENLKTEIVLPRKTKLTELTIRVLERERGTKHGGCVGFSEVELRMGEEKGGK